ncbi:M10 family metallopeptidase C-terminal domain-containing protein [Salipiger sp.]|uniref:M10 family metallopeptidase C-terminal domain-containing protein n=1 Tax=Salipiger sp. TaxID=2078585 RepID=UPI003A97BA6D
MSASSELPRGLDALRGAGIGLPSVAAKPPGDGPAPSILLVRDGDERPDSLLGSEDSDTLRGFGGRDTLIGLGGDDDLQGGDGPDYLYGQEGDDSLSGGDGDDYLSGGDGADAFDGGAGFDMASYEFVAQRIFADLQGTTDRGGPAAGDTFVSVEGIFGGFASDDLRGDGGGNALDGGPGWDRLYGRAGNDTLDGGGGGDALYGNLGADVMYGGDDLMRDRFIYFSAAESPAGAGNRDRIVDFHPGEDRIELSRIDADTTQGFKQAFTFIGNAGFSGTAGELGYRLEGGNTVVMADRDGDGTADFEIELTGELSLSAGDFLI